MTKRFDERGAIVSRDGDLKELTKVVMDFQISVTKGLTRVESEMSHVKNTQVDTNSKLDRIQRNQDSCPAKNQYSVNERRIRAVEKLAERRKDSSESIPSEKILRILNSKQDDTGSIDVNTPPGLIQAMSAVPASGWSRFSGIIKYVIGGLVVGLIALGAYLGNDGDSEAVDRAVRKLEKKINVLASTVGGDKEPAAVDEE